MKSSDAYADLLRLDRPVVETGEAAARLGLTIVAASHHLKRLESSGLVRRLRRGLWSLASDLDPFVLPPYLTAPLPSYVSLWSALAVHGMIEQTPRRVYVASLARSQQISTTIGDYSIHHLAPELFGGYVHVDQGGDVAGPEKALFDTIYLLTPRGGKIRLPELELPADFEEGSLREWTALIESARVRTLVARGLDRAVTKASRASESATRRPGSAPDGFRAIVSASRRSSGAVASGARRAQSPRRRR